MLNGILVAIGIVGTGLIAWYLFDNEMIAIRKHAREMRAGKVASGEVEKGDSGFEVLFILLGALVFIGAIFWFALAN